MDGKGGLVATPSIIVYSNGDTVVKAGKFYRPSNGDVFIGIEIQSGRNNCIPKLYPVDISRIDRTTTITITSKK